jgi:hypothetical protein
LFFSYSVFHLATTLFRTRWFEFYSNTAKDQVGN